MTQTLWSERPEKTCEIARQIAADLKGGEVIALCGELGSGKTAFTAFLAEALGCRETVTSPTFVIFNRYASGRLTVNHFDMYRISGFDDLYTTGYFDVAGQPDSVTVIEWAERVLGDIPCPDYRIAITRDPAGEPLRRQFVIEKKEDGYASAGV